VKARRRNAAACAIAVYLFDRSELHVRVSADSVEFVGPLGVIALSHPEQLREFIRKFDNGNYPELDAKHRKGPLPPAYYTDSAA
jgi:hypothetical protein